jgi:hypothetical protein
VQAGTAAGLFADRPYVYLLVIDFGLPQPPAPIAAPVPAPAPAPVPAPAPAPTPTPIPAPVQEVPGGLAPHDQAWQLWQMINQARANPRATLARLGIPESTARAAFGAEAWLIDQGLPPLAWHDRLRSSSRGRAELAVSRFTTPGGPPTPTPQARLGAVGYASLLAAESVAIKIQKQPTAAGPALAAMLDTMLRQELTGAFWVGRNIFSVQHSEIGIAHQEIGAALLTPAERNVLSTWPQAYLLVLDFAKPTAPRRHVLGYAPLGGRLLLTRPGTTVQDELTQVTGGGFQFELPSQGWAQITILDYLGRVTGQRVIAPAGWANYTLDLR